MATLVLSAAGSAIGGAFGGGFLGISGAVIGRAVGATVGSAIDQRLIGRGSAPVSSGKVDQFRLLSSAEGAPIPRVYGNMRMSGQVIWASRFREETATSGGGKSGPKVVSHSYSVSLAIALCEGEVRRIGRIWADGNEIALDTINWRLHLGSEDQLPDGLIEAIEGAGNVPAYRGIAYVVFEDLDLAPFGNRVPQFNVEVVRRVADKETQDAFSAVRAVSLIPGTGEYALSTRKIHMDKGLGNSPLINVNNALGRPDFEVSLDQMAVEMPQVDCVGLVVSWFGDDLRCGNCALRPKVEQNATDALEMPWSVSGQSRGTAQVVSQIDGRPAFGGTPSDQSVVEAIQRMYGSGQKVMFYPFVLMDIPGGNLLPDPWTGGVGQSAFPWRGRITLDLSPEVAGTTDKTPAAANDVSEFFGTSAIGDFSVSGSDVSYLGPDEWSYRRFILHYANLCKAAGGVDAFCIGSELRSLTQIRDGQSSFPAVQALVALAADVRAILGPATKITYAADWSEYFGYHPQDGSGDVYFHLDPLWASPDIDAIGIDNYMPLSDWRDGGNHADAQHLSIYNLDYLSGNIAGGEGYDWYYLNDDDRAAQIRLPITDGAFGEDWTFRYKDLKSWWLNPHFDRTGGVKHAAATDWVPQSKPFWFTEIGCPAVDKGTNQPNVFVDPKSSESELPHFSTGARDDYIQFRYLQAHWNHWGDEANNPTSSVYGAPMVDLDRAYVWAWDARPWPEFPDRTGLWSDGANYGRGHWINGRMGNASLAAIVADVSERSGFFDYDVSGLSGSVQGFVVNDAETARQSLQPLMLANGFDAFEQDGKVVFRNRGAVAQAAFNEAQFAVDREHGGFERVRESAGDAPEFVQITYVQASNNFLTGSASAGAPVENEAHVTRAGLPIALNDGAANAIAVRWLTEAQVSQDSAEVLLPPSALALTPGDVVRIDGTGNGALFRIDAIEDRDLRSARCTRIEEGVYVTGATVERNVERPSFTFPAPAFVRMMDLPMIRGDEVPHAPRVAVAAVPWTGAFDVLSSAVDGDYAHVGRASGPSTAGYTDTDLPVQLPGLWAENSNLLVSGLTGPLSSQSAESVLNGANVAAMRAPGGADWEIIQFRDATLAGSGQYLLDGLLRGQAGTDHLVTGVMPAGSEFVLLNGSAVQLDVPPSQRGLERHYRVGPASRPHDDDSYAHFKATFEGVGMRPYAPVHLAAHPDGLGGFQLSWTRRTRIGGDSWMGLDVPVGEESESYVVSIETGGLVEATYGTESPSFHYDAGKMALDGVSVPFDVTVSQVSQQFGPGPITRRSVDG